MIITVLDRSYIHIHMIFLLPFSSEFISKIFVLNVWVCVYWFRPLVWTALLMYRMEFIYVLDIYVCWLLAFGVFPPSWIWHCKLQTILRERERWRCIKCVSKWTINILFRFVWVVVSLFSVKMFKSEYFIRRMFLWLVRLCEFAMRFSSNYVCLLIYFIFNLFFIVVSFMFHWLLLLPVLYMYLIYIV